MESVHLVRIVIDLMVAFIGLILFLYFTFFAIPFKSSFYCADYYTINLPFKKSTVTTVHLYLICLGLPPLIFLITEVLRSIYFRLEFSNNKIKKNKDQQHLFETTIYRNFDASLSSPFCHRYFDAEAKNNIRKKHFYIVKLASDKQLKVPKALGNIYVIWGSYIIGLLATGNHFC